MSTNVTWNGITYSIPASGETGWAALSSFLLALGNGAAVAEEMKQAIRVATTSPVTVSDTTDCVIAVNRSVAGATTVNLPAGTDGRWFVICDQKADAGTNNITVTPNGAETINGSATYVMSQNNEAIIIAYSVTNTRWNVVGRFTSGAPLSNPMATTGDMIYGGSSGVSTKLATGATTGLLHGGNGAIPTWSQVVNADVSASAAIAWSKVATTGAVVDADVSASAAIAVAKLAAVTASRALVSDGSGKVSAATTTATQVGYLSGATGTTGTTSTNVVFSTSPTLTTPIIDTVSAGAVANDLTLRTGASSGAVINFKAGTTPSTVAILGASNTSTFQVDKVLAGISSNDLSLNTGSGAGAQILFKVTNTTGTTASFGSAGTFSVGPFDATQVIAATNSTVTASSTKRVIDLKYDTDTDCTGGYFLACLNSSGTVIGRIEAASNTTTNFTGTSDERLKQNPSSFEAIPILKRLDPIEAEWISAPGARIHTFYAQALHKVYPQAVSVGDDTVTESGALANPWGVDLSRLVPLLTKAVLELTAEIDTVKAALAAKECKTT